MFRTEPHATLDRGTGELAGAAVRIYLSSSFSARESGKDDLLQLRRDLQVDAARSGIEVVLGEDDPGVAEAARAGDHFRILEGCARLIGTCQAFFGMTFERHGSAVVLHRDPILVSAQVSFFEAELLEACFQSMPCCVVQVREMEPSPSMREFLGLVSDTLGRNLLAIDRADIPAEFKRFATAVARREAKVSPWLFDPISLRRVRRAPREEAGAPRLSFLGDGLRTDGRGGADPVVIQLALQQVQEAKRLGSDMGHIAKLSYLWIAIREMARAAKDERLGAHNKDLQAILALWNESAAWHGLHGSHPMGCLAALNELSFARESASENNPPDHPRASAYHSIGNKIRLPATARRFYLQAIALCEKGLVRRNADRVTLRQQRASAQARLALLGERWRYFLALHDFRFAFDGRVRMGATDGKVGEAETEFAYALFKMPWHRKQAMKLMNEGVTLLQADPSTRSSGFLFRALRKQGEMLMQSGHLDQAEHVVSRGRDLAASAEAYDQSRNLDTLLEQIRAQVRSTR